MTEKQDRWCPSCDTLDVFVPVATGMYAKAVEYVGGCRAPGCSGIVVEESHPAKVCRRCGWVSLIHEYQSGGMN